MARDARSVRAQRFPLHTAVEQGDVNKVLTLIKKDVSRMELNRQYETSGEAPLHLAAGRGDTNIIRILVESGARVDQIDCVHQTPLHYSILTNNIDSISYIIKCGGNVNVRRMKDGWTPVFLAATFGTSQVVRLLVEAGADVLLADNLGLTPEDWAAKYRLKTIQQILRRAPRHISEESGRKYKETRGERIETPVQFDDSINKLLAKIELKRKEKMIKVEVKVEEQERILVNNLALETAENSIVSRQKRLDTFQQNQKVKSKQVKPNLKTENYNNQGISETNQDKKVKVESNDASGSKGVKTRTITDNSQSSIKTVFPESNPETFNTSSRNNDENNNIDNNKLIYDPSTENYKNTEDQGGVKNTEAQVHMQNTKYQRCKQRIRDQESKEILEDKEIKPIIEDQESKKVTEDQENKQIKEDQKSIPSIGDQKSKQIIQVQEVTQIIKDQENKQIKKDQENKQIRKDHESKQITEYQESKPLRENQESIEITVVQESIQIIEDQKSIESLRDQESKQIIQVQEVKQIIKDQENKQIIKDQENKQIIKDQENKEIMKDQENKQIRKDQENKQISKDQENKQIIKDQENKTDQESKQITEDQESKQIIEDQESKQTEDQESKHITADQGCVQGTKENVMLASNKKYKNEQSEEKQGEKEIKGKENSIEEQYTNKMNHIKDQDHDKPKINSISSCVNSENIPSKSTTNPVPTNAPESSTKASLEPSLLNSAERMDGENDYTNLDGLRVLKCDILNLEKHVQDQEFNNKMKVFNNYKQFGHMYASKGNNKKSEWAFSNGIKQAELTVPKSLEQFKIIKQTEIEFRILRARCMQEVGRVDELKEECSRILKIDPANSEVSGLLEKFT